VGGRFLAGTQSQPFQHQLTFVLSGDYYGPQQPMFGNKGIACMECFFSLHGQVRQYTWTLLANSVQVNDLTLTVQDAVDWRVGETIVVASTSFDHYEAERRNIVAINGTTITVDAPFKNLHFAGVENYGSSDKIEMRA
jgi:cell migration-inducing and hyaluronan-binding protein